MRPKELLSYSFPHLLIANTCSDTLKLDVGFFINQTFTMAFNPCLSKRLSGLVSTLTLQNFSTMKKTFANYNYDDWAVFLIDVTEKPKILL